ncbi:MAG: alpha/beta fold hydrolase [Flavobacterium sp.]|nr:MAG: alpha/beta fold hydrolase [Flavobacterium sp.]
MKLTKIYHSQILKAACLLLMVTTAVLFTSCKKDADPTTSKPVKTFVLVHGAFQGAYSWKQVKEDLEKQGQRVLTVELPGHGDDKTDPATITMDSYKNKVVSTIQGLTGKVILVGHSMGGMVISATAEAIPEKIERLIYVGAFVPANGQSLQELSLGDPDSKLKLILQPTAQGTIEINDLSKLTEVFCADASTALKTELLSKYRPDPIAPFAENVMLSIGKFGSVNKSYIRTINDLAIGLAAQNKMLTAAAIKDVYDLQSSHCPHLSKPVELSNLLVKISN